MPPQIQTTNKGEKDMKNIFKILSVALLAALSCSCSKEVLSGTSVIVTSVTEQNDFDRWLEATYRNPYNIEFKYRYELNESDLNYYTIPADMDCAIIMAHLVQYLCVETYNEVAGVVFTRKYFPKMFFCMGEWEYNNNGTFILGTAEGGKKIMLSGLNYLTQYMDSAEDLNHYYIKTIHHEFTHILNQTKEYSTDFKMITATGYVADSWNEEPYNKGFLQRGFLTMYSQHSDTEDFAEMMSEYVTHGQEWWDAQLEEAEDGAQYIKAKLEIVRTYMQETFNIDIDVLRAAILRRQDDVVEGKIDLKDITIR